MILNDEKDIGAGLERLLRYAGHEAVSVTDGIEGFAMLYIRKPSLLVLVCTSARIASPIR